MLQVLHNPRCGKSRNCLAFLTQNNQSFETRLYLQNPLSESEIKDLLQKIGLPPMAIVRQKETVWVTNYQDKSLTDNEVIKVLCENPILIERPILIKGNKAIIARDLEKLEAFI
jgi:arsenate reductase